MNTSNYHEKLIKSLCETYHIGEPLSKLSRCTGGLLHHTYRFSTTQGQFIIKFLNPFIINQLNRKQRYRVTECIARELSKYTFAISALTHQNDPLFSYGNDTLMLFPYVDGNILAQSEIEFYHVEKMGQVLAEIHIANVKISQAPEIEMPTLELFRSMIEKKITIQNNEIAKKLNMGIPFIHVIDEHCQKYESMLRKNIVISHRDCDPKNVLWDANGRYFIIDWESAGAINRTKDMLATAIYWSLDNDFKVNLDKFSIFLQSYQKNQGIIFDNEIEAGLFGFLGDWLSWIDYNLSRMQNYPEENEEYRLAIRELNNTLTALPILLNQFSALIKTSYES